MFSKDIFRESSHFSLWNNELVMKFCSLYARTSCAVGNQQIIICWLSALEDLAVYLICLQGAVCHSTAVIDHCFDYSIILHLSSEKSAFFSFGSNIQAIGTHLLVS